MVAILYVKMQLLDTIRAGLMKDCIDSMSFLRWWKKIELHLMLKSLRKILGNGVRPRLKETNKKVKNLFTEVV